MYQSKLQSEEANHLFKAILSLQSVEECYRFFEDLCTVTELHALSPRLEEAALLSRGETYTAIAEKTGASTATISRVNRCLSYGADGYQTVLARLDENRME